MMRKIVKILLRTLFLLPFKIAAWLFMQVLQYVVFVALSVLLVVGVFWYQHETGVPQELLTRLRECWSPTAYLAADCFAEIQRAQRERDITALRRHVDLPALSLDLAQAQQAGYGTLEAILMRDAEGLPLRDMAAAIEINMVDAVETGQASGLWLFAPPVPQDIREERKWNVAGIEIEEPTGRVCFARIRVEFSGLERDAWARYRLRDTGTHWQIARMDTESYRENIEQVRLESISLQNMAIEQKNIEVLSHIGQTLRVDAVSRRQIHRYFSSNSMIFTVSSENMADRTIVRYQGVLRCINTDSGKVMAEIPFRIRTEKAAQDLSDDTFEVRVGFFDDLLKAVYRTPDESLTYDLDIRSVMFADGEELTYQEKIQVQ